MATITLDNVIKRYGDTQVIHGVSLEVADGELIVIADSPAWAARLRFEGDKLLAAARDAGEQVTTVSVRVTHNV